MLEASDKKLSLHVEQPARTVFLDFALPPLLTPAMTTPAWRPPPDTSHLDEGSREDILEAARLRNIHRSLMAIRWRNRKCRAWDLKLGRLPADWHDWMRCPAPEGYQTVGCTCDSWYRKKEPKISQTPTLQQTAPKKETQISNKAIPPLRPRLIKSIDLLGVVPILLGHANKLQAGDVEDPEGDYIRGIQPKIRGQFFTKPAWLWRKRCCVPGLRGCSHPANRVT